MICINSNSGCIFNCDPTGGRLQTNTKWACLKPPGSGTQLYLALGVAAVQVPPEALSSWAGAVGDEFSPGTVTAATSLLLLLGKGRERLFSGSIHYRTWAKRSHDSLKAETGGTQVLCSPRNARGWLPQACSGNYCITLFLQWQKWVFHHSAV